MNIISFAQRRISAQIFAALTIVSLLLSAFPVAFFVAEAAVPVEFYTSPTLAVGANTYSTTGDIDATGYENIKLSFDFDAAGSGVSADGLEPDDTFKYGYRFGSAIGTQVQLGSLVGETGAGASEIGSVVNLVVPAAANNAPDLQFYFYVESAGGTDDVAVSNISVTGDVVSSGTVRNVEDNLFFATIQDAIAAATTGAGETIELTADIVTVAQVTINKAITLDGNGNTISPMFAKTTNDNNSVIKIGSNGVTIKNLIINGAGGTQLHGINAYKASNILVKDVTVNNINRSAIVANGSEMIVENITTTGSGGGGWSVMNADQGSGVTEPTVLTVRGVSSHDEPSPATTPHIKVDDTGKDVTVIDENNQYDYIFIPFPTIAASFVAVSPGIGLYTLKTVTAPIYGCMDEEADNYDENATEQGDVVCTYPQEVLCENLLLNGSFEDDLVNNADKWQKFLTISNWLIQKTSDNSATTLELHRDWSSNEAAEGKQYAELDGDHSTKVSQTVTTIPGGAYELSWAFAPRHNIAAEQNHMSVRVNGVEIATAGPVTGSADLTPSDWMRNDHGFIATGTATQISFADIGPSNSFGTFLDDARLCLVRKPEPTATVVAQKIICTDESQLPNGNVSKPISATTASDWVANPNHDTCSLVNDWQFEWAPSTESDPGDTLVGPAGGNWTTFTGSTQVPASVFAGGYFWMREVLQAGYIPFTHEANGGNSDNVTAEMYCHKDAINFDNRDRIDNPEDGGTYYCVAWNVPETPKLCTIKLTSDDTNTVVEKGGAFAKVLSYIHPAWTTSLVDADWIWGDDGVTNPAQAETQTFVNQFGWGLLSATHATLTIAADNSFSASLNSNLADQDLTEFNFGATKSYDVTSLVNSGNNELSVVVKNFAGTNSPTANPAGLYYELEITGEGENCDIPYVPESDDATLVITNPAIDGTTLSGEHTFAAEYKDDDATVDHINWAIRAGTCAAGVGTVAGNVDGFNDTSSFVGIDFTTTVDMSTWASGEYCFVVNPSEGPGEDDLRATRTFFLESTPDYGPYCGDGIQNGEWEQCDGKDVTEGEQCTDYCTLANQCSSLQLVKVTLDPTNEPASVSFDNTLHLGSAGNLIPNGTWFNFNEVGDATFQSIASGIDGLAISRDTVNGKLGLAFVGGNSSKHLDIVKGNIMTKGIDLGAVNRKPDTNPSTQFVLENAGQGFEDIFAKDTNNGVSFDLRADTGNDGVTVVIGQGEEYDCVECNAEVEARIVIRDTDGAAIANGGLGNLLPQVILGDGSVVPFGTWFKISEATSSLSAGWIDDAETVTNFTNAANLQGLFVSREGNGKVKVALYGYHNPGGDVNYESLRATIEFNDAKVLSGSTVQIPGNFKLENHSETDNVISNDNFDSFSEAANLESVDFDFWVDTAADGITITLDDEEVAMCVDDTDPVDPDVEPKTYLIEGYKYVVNENTESSSPYAGWRINASNGVDDDISTTTDSNGYYYFEVEAGDWTVSEEMPTDWEQVQVSQSDFVTLTDGEPLTCVFNIAPVQYYRVSSFITDDQDSYRCDFTNEYIGSSDPEVVLGCTDSTALNYVASATPGNELANSCTYKKTTTRSGNSGTKIKKPAPTPLVLGASTVSQCPFIKDFMQIGLDNDKWEVTKLQMFLTMVMGLNTPITGVFDTTTDANVKLFQEKYRSEILDPWFVRGIVPHDRPTGFVYKTTLWKINSIVCPDYAILPSFDGEDLTKNVDINRN